MHKKGALLLSILLIIVITVSLLWKDEKPEATPLPIESTTEVIPSEDNDRQDEDRFKLERKQPSDLSKEDSSVPTKGPHTFRLVNTKSEGYQVTLSDGKISFSGQQKPITIVNLFATWCPPCMGQSVDLNDLQKKDQQELFVASVLTHDTIDKASLETLMAKEQINYFISHSADNDKFANILAGTLDLDENFSIPLTVMYLNGQYFTHYEGSVPVEMIKYDIQQAKKQLKSR